MTVNQARTLALMRALPICALAAVSLAACGAPQDGSQGDGARSGQLRFMEDSTGASAAAPAARVGGGG
ncbi:MAG: hypothetical protein LAT81_09775, partial [Oceanicaulis sp.]|nr:hypothetical protein [Oceanicaulis sp.]